MAISCVYVLQAMRWRRIAATARPNAVGFLEMVVGAVACNNVLPGRLGELFRARWLAVEAPVPLGRALATVGVDRGCDVVALFAFLGISLPFVASAAWVAESSSVRPPFCWLSSSSRCSWPRGATHEVRQRERRKRGRLRRIARDIVDTLAEPLGRALVR